MIRLSETEHKIVEALREAEEMKVEELARRSSLPASTIMAGIELLREKGLLEVSRVKKITYRLTEEGRRALLEGFPEEKLIRLLEAMGGEADIRKLADRMDKNTLTVALGWAKKLGWVRIKRGRVVLLKPGAVNEKHRMMLKKAAEGKAEGDHGFKELASRHMLEPVEEHVVIVRPLRRPEEILAEAMVEASRLTPEMLVSGTWRKYSFKPYNVVAEPPRLYPGKKHFFVEFMNMVRSILYEMGFKEAEGPYVETEFWNYDVLFQAQDHPAREIHDTFWLKHPSRGSLEELGEIMERVRSIHEHGGRSGSTGWGYKWDPAIAARLVLRSQTTAVSARVLASSPKPPLRVFSIGRVFRPDVIDSRHLPEFHQFEGIVMEEDMSFSRLLGVIKEFFERLGIEEVKFKPGYFPFTEPSVEGYVWIEGKGWVEVFGAGMFRPEVLEALGVENPVGAWGMGLDRIAMTLMGIDDIRKMYSQDISWLREQPVRWWLRQ